MYFGLSEEQKSLEESITKYLGANAPLETIKAVADGEIENPAGSNIGIINSISIVPNGYAFENGIKK